MPRRAARTALRAGALLIAVVVLAASCASASSTAGSAASAAPLSDVPTSPPVDPQEVDSDEELIVAGVNIALADVELDEIVFDTFDGGSITLAEADEEQIVGLHNAIPPIDEPRYIAGAAATWLTADDIVLGYLADDGTAWAHPHRVLNFHEIVNTTLADRPVVITYCPLCGSGAVFDRRPNDLRHDGALTFDNTSALYENDMVMVDAETNTYWWQVAGRGIVGNLTGTELTLLPAATTSWGAWLATHPHTQVLSDDQGLGRSYARDPFVDYGTVIDSGRTPFPVDSAAFADKRLSPSTRVIGFDVDGAPGAVAVLANRPQVVAIAGNDPSVVLLDGRGGGQVFRSAVEGEVSGFSATDAGAFIDDLTGSTWDAAGRAIAGPAEGSQLDALPSRSAFWFAWVAANAGRTSRLFTPSGEVDG